MISDSFRVRALLYTQVSSAYIVLCDIYSDKCSLHWKQTVCLLDLYRIVRSAKKITGVVCKTKLLLRRPTNVECFVIALRRRARIWSCTEISCFNLKAMLVSWVMYGKEKLEMLIWVDRSISWKCWWALTVLSLSMFRLRLPICIWWWNLIRSLKVKQQK